MNSLLAAIGRLAVRFRWFAGVAWVTATVLVHLYFPTLASAAKINTISFLPGCPGMQSARLTIPLPGGNQIPGRVVIGRGSGTLAAPDIAAIERLASRLAAVTHAAAGQGSRHQRRWSVGATGGPGQHQHRCAGSGETAPRPPANPPISPQTSMQHQSALDDASSPRPSGCQTLWRPRPQPPVPATSPRASANQILRNVQELETTMRAIRHYAYGSPEVLRLEETGIPAVSDEDVLVRVRAASVNPLDWHFMRGTPYLVRAQAGLWRPRASGLGADMAGCVEAVGKNVTKFQTGDEVFGSLRLSDRGTFAEYVRVHQNATVLTKPANLTFEQAASVPVAGFTALQALRDQGRIRPGHKVLVNGAAGGWGRSRCRSPRHSARR